MPESLCKSHNSNLTRSDIVTWSIFFPFIRYFTVERWQETHEEREREWHATKVPSQTWIPCSRHVRWMAEMGQIPMLTIQDGVGCVRVKLNLITLNDFGWCGASMFGSFSGASVLLGAKSDILELSQKIPSHNYNLDVGINAILQDW